MSAGVADGHEATVVADVQPLVGVRRPRVGAADAVHQVCERRRHGGPQAEGAVDVDPRVRVALERRGDLADRVEAAGVHVAGLCRHDQRPVDRRDRGSCGVRLHPPLVVGRDADHPVAPEAQVLEGGEQGGMCLLTDDDRDLRCAVQAPGLDVPALLRQHRVPSGREAHRVAQPGAGRQADARVARQVEQLQHPGAGGLLGGRGGRRQGVDDGVLGPGAGQPVGRSRRRQGPADHEPEVAGPDAGHEPGVDGRGELLDDRDRIHRSFGQAGRQALADLRGIGAGADMALRQAGQVLQPQLRGAPQRPFAIVHRDRSYRPAISPPSTAIS